jgi:LuxR family maltose regulon positive regulatory protein
MFAARAREAAGRLEDGTVPNVLGLIANPADVLVAAQLAEGMAHLHQGDFDGARWALSPVIDGTHAAWSIVSLGGLALLECWSGRLTIAEDLARQALTLAANVGDNETSTTIARVALAYVACERDELEVAATALAEVTARLDGERRGVMAVLVDLAKAEVALAEGNAERALHRLASRRVIDDGSVPLLAARRRAIEARAWMAAGDQEHAQEVLGAARPLEHVELSSVRVQIAIELGDVATARDLLSRWPDEPEPRASLLRIVWLALIAQREGNEDSALALWSTVVGAAATEMNFGLFRSAGDGALTLSRTFYRTTPTPFLRSVVEHLSARAPTRPRSAKALIEQLTEREHTVLAMLSTHFSSTEIAERLGISRNTLKTHLKHIYRKLEVEGRSEAVAKGERLHLL